MQIGYDFRAARQPLGRSEAWTAMIDIRVLSQGGKVVIGLWDRL